MGENQLVFVYGTLLSGFWNNQLLHSSLKYGAGITVEKHFIMGGNGIPYVDVALDSDKGGQIRGEVWEVDIETLARLDKLEGHPHWYERRVTKVLCMYEIVEAWMYYNNSAHSYDLSRYMCVDGEYRLYDYRKGMNANV